MLDIKSLMDKAELSQTQLAKEMDKKSPRKITRQHVNQWVKNKHYPCVHYAAVAKKVFKERGVI